MEQTRLELYHTIQRPQVREVEREDGTKAVQFEGYAIVFDEPSVVMVDWWEDKCFREYIKPEAISQEMLDTTDIICTAFHNREKLLARHHADGSGTMQLKKDDIGVKVSFEFPNSPLGHETAESVRRGDMPGMSFSFYENEYTYTDKKGADGIFERTIDKIDSIFEVTVASSPAYPATTAKCREAWMKAKEAEKREEGTSVNTERTVAEEERARAEEEAKRKAAEEAEKREKETLKRRLDAMQREMDIIELENGIFF